METKFVPNFLWLIKTVHFGTRSSYSFLDYNYIQTCDTSRPVACGSCYEDVEVMVLHNSLVHPPGVK